MDAEDPALPLRPRVWLYVFSITVDWSRLEEVLALLGGRRRICVLTPHLMLPDERERLLRMAGAECEFRTFHDLLDVAEMEHCDEEADRLVVAAHGERSGRDELVDVYYATLTRLKNQRILEKLQTQFNVEGGAILCGDLGIVPEVWHGLGLAHLAPSTARPRRSLWAKIDELFSSPMPFHYLNWNGGSWLLAGRPARVGQYLDQNAVNHLFGLPSSCTLTALKEGLSANGPSEIVKAFNNLGQEVDFPSSSGLVIVQYANGKRFKILK